MPIIIIDRTNYLTIGLDQLHHFKWYAKQPITDIRRSSGAP